MKMKIFALIWSINATIIETNNNIFLQALQEECDKLTDDLELKSNEIKELKKIIQTSDKGGIDLRNQIDDLSRKMETSEQNLVALQSEKAE